MDPPRRQDRPTLSHQGKEGPRLTFSREFTLSTHPALWDLCPLFFPQISFSVSTPPLPAWLLSGEESEPRT